jgi:filamentous hemagglutinin family protein
VRKFFYLAKFLAEVNDMSSRKDIAKLYKPVLENSFFLATILVSFVGVIGTKASLAQVITPEPAPGGTGTTVTPLGNRFDIGGGQLSGDGKNLFHSFTDFGLQQNQIANFLSQPAIQNVLGRINGGNPSIINGILQVTGSNSNLYLMNPAGIIFGQNASLNVPASFTATTANGIGFGSNGWFSASGSNDYPSLGGSPSSLAFTTGQAGAIVNAANLALQQGQNLTLVGGTVVSTGYLSAPGVDIVVAAVPGTSLVRISQPGSPLSLEIQPITSGSSQPNSWNNSVLSLPQLLTGSGADSATGLSVNPDGTVQLKGSDIRVENGDVVTGNINTSSTVSSISGGSILISAQRNINTTLGILNSSYSSTASSGSGNGGTIALTTFNGNIATADLDSHAFAGSSANGGTITLTTFNGNIDTGNLSSYVDISSNANTGSVNGGAITLGTVNGNITTDNLNSHASNPSSNLNLANGGAITVATVNGNITTADLDSRGAAFQGPFGIGTGGAITFTLQNGNITTGNLSSFGSGRTANGGAITFTLQNGNITTGNLSSFGSGLGGNGGDIAVSTINGNITTGNLDSQSSFVSNPIQQGGNIAVSTVNGNITTANLISQGSEGGNIAVSTVNGNITTANLISQGFINGGNVAVTTQNGKIATGDVTSSATQNAGTVGISAGNSITSGEINSSSFFRNGNSVTLTAGQDIAVSSISAQGSPSSKGGTVNLTAGDTITISDSFTALDGVTTASISTQGGTGGGQIRIVTGGGLQNPFKVGDPTTNGTAKDITSGDFRILSTPVFTVPSPIYTQGNIEIITLP